MTDSDKIMAVEHLAPLDADNIPNANQAHFCLSCDAAISGMYCAACGQKNDDMRRSISVLIIEFLASITALESRIWRTWTNLLFNPGKVAREFANGRRTYWSSPVRIYLAMSLILFGFMNVTQTHLFSLDINVKPLPNITKYKTDLTSEDLTFSISTHFFETQKMIDRRNANRDFDLINLKLSTATNFDISLTGDEDADDKENSDTQTTPPPQSIIDNIKSELEAENIPPKQLQALEDAAQLKINGKKVSRETAQDFLINFIKEPASVTQVFNTWLPRIMFLMMPFTMLIGAVFIRGRGNALLYDHLVHAAYIHTVAFFFIFIGIVLTRIVPGLKVASSVFILLAIYLPISLKRMFKRSWLKTIWASYGVATIYLFSIFLVLIWLTAYSLRDNFI